MHESAGSVTAAVSAEVPAPKTMPPAVGRTNISMTSLTLSSAGILSGDDLDRQQHPTIGKTQPFSSHAHPAGASPVR